VTNDSCQIIPVRYMRCFLKTTARTDLWFQFCPGKKQAVDKEVNEFETKGVRVGMEHLMLN